MRNDEINVLVACEESQRVCTEFRKRGFNAYSNDVVNESGGVSRMAHKNGCQNGAKWRKYETPNWKKN